MAVDAISELEAESGVRAEGSVRARDCTADTSGVMVHTGQAEGGFRVPRVKLESITVVPVASRPPVAAWPIGVADVKVEDHVIDHVLDIEEVFVSGVARAVGVVALDALIEGVLGEIAVEEVHQAVPCVVIAVGGGVLVERVPGVAVAAEIRGGKSGVGTLDGIVEAPVPAVDEQVHEAGMRSDAAHEAHAFSSERV